MLQIHLKEKHEIDIAFIALQFSCIQEYNIWFQEQRIEATYLKRNVKYPKKNEYKVIDYFCNRSNIKGNNLLMEKLIIVL